MNFIKDLGRNLIAKALITATGVAAEFITRKYLADYISKDAAKKRGPVGFAQYAHKS